MSKFQQWYSKLENRDSLNKRRRERYAKDKKYRTKALAATRDWRKRNPVVPVKKPKTYLTISEFSAAVGCDPQTIRDLEAKGMLPPAGGPKSHRRYLKKHVKLVKPLISYRAKTHYRDPRYKDRVSSLSAEIHAGW